jgi:putative membrane protein
LTLITTFSPNWVATIVIVLASAAYLSGIFLAGRAGHSWPALPTLGFFLLGLGSYAVVEFGFLGSYSADLRWAFSTRIALLLFAVPGLVTTGRPIALARLAFSGLPAARLERILDSRVIRLVGNAVFAPLFALAAFSIFLTPLAGVLRQSPVAEASVSVIVPLVGLLMVLPITELTRQRTSFFIAAEFLLAFVELVVDAIPGIVLRLNDIILDRVPAAVGNLPAWFPTVLHDQHLSGDYLWFIAELADIPILILLFVRWSRVDRKEAKVVDALSDEEMDALTAEHLRVNRR